MKYNKDKLVLTVFAVLYILLMAFEDIYEVMSMVGIATPLWMFHVYVLLTYGKYVFVVLVLLAIYINRFEISSVELYPSEEVKDNR